MEIAGAFGEVTFGGIRYILDNQAEATNYGTDGDIRYVAVGHIVDSGAKKTHEIVWETVPEYKEHIWTDEGLCSVCQSHTCFFGDESNCCNWDKPILVQET